MEDIIFSTFEPSSRPISDFFTLFRKLFKVISWVKQSPKGHEKALEAFLNTCSCFMPQIHICWSSVKWYTHKYIILTKFQHFSFHSFRVGPTEIFWCVTFFWLSPNNTKYNTKSEITFLTIKKWENIDLRQYSFNFMFIFSKVISWYSQTIISVLGIWLFD